MFLIKPKIIFMIMLYIIAEVFHMFSFYFATSCSFRCNCHGHADNCDTAMEPYRCLCIKESYTEGSNVSLFFVTTSPMNSIKSGILDLGMRTYLCMLVFP